jgi:hypothetical protein
MELYVKFLHIVVHQSHFIIAHEPVVVGEYEREKVEEACRSPYTKIVTYNFMTSVSIRRRGEDISLVRATCLLPKRQRDFRCVSEQDEREKNTGNPTYC